MKLWLLALLIAVPPAFAQEENEPEESGRPGSGISMGGAGIGQGAADSAPRAAPPSAPEPQDSNPCAGAPARAQRLQIAVGVAPGATSGSYALAKIDYDCVNRVYLSVAGNPIRGQYWDKDGKRLGGEFLISVEERGYVAWPTVTFGGPAGDPAFLVTYVVAAGSNPQYGRLVRPGGRVGRRSKIVDVEGEWYASEKARSVWDGRRFIVGTRVKTAGLPFPYPQLRHFDMSGAVSDGHKLGDGLDHEGSPALACAPSGICLGVGFGGKGTYARRFSARTLEPFGELLYLDDQRGENQHVVFNARTGMFLTAWDRSSYAFTRTVSVSGTPGPLNKSFGPGAGDVAIAYNAASGTTLLLSKWSPPPLNVGADLYAMALGDDGYPVPDSEPVLVTRWDEKVKAYYPSIGVDGATGRWLALFGLADGTHAAAVQSLSLKPATAKAVNAVIKDGGAVKPGTLKLLEKAAEE